MFFIVSFYVVSVCFLLWTIVSEINLIMMMLMNDDDDLSRKYMNMNLGLPSRDGMGTI